MKKFLFLFLSILVMSCSSDTISANLDGDKSTLSDALNFSLNDTQLGNDKADFTAFEIRDGAVVGKDGSDTTVYFSVPTLYPDFNATVDEKISQLEIMTALDEAFSTAITNQPSLRAKLAPDAVDVVVVEIDTTTAPPTTATVVVRLFAAEGYKFGSSISRSYARSGVGNTVKDIIIKVGVGKKKSSTRTGTTTKIGLVAITEFDYYLAPTKTTAGVEYTKINLDDSATFKNLVIIPPTGSKYTSHKTADKAINSFILNATIHGTSLNTDGTVVSVPTLSVKEVTRNNSKTDSNHTVTLTITKTTGYTLPSASGYTRTVNSKLSSGKFVDGTVITDALIGTIKFKDQPIGKATLNASGLNLANGSVTVSGTGIVTVEQVLEAVTNVIKLSEGTHTIGVANAFTVGELKLSGTKTMETTVTINTLPNYVFEDNKKTKTIPLTITATGGVTFHDGKVYEATLITELNKIANGFNGKTIGNAKFSGAKMTKEDGFTATITSDTAVTLTKAQITNGVRSLLADMNPPTGIVNERIELKGADISDSGKTFKATVTFNIADGYSSSDTLSYNVTFKADENVTFTE